MHSGKSGGKSCSYSPRRERRRAGWRKEPAVTGLWSSGWHGGSAVCGPRPRGRRKGVVSSAGEKYARRPAGTYIAPRCAIGKQCGWSVLENPEVGPWRRGVHVSCRTWRALSRPARGPGHLTGSCHVHRIATCDRICGRYRTTESMSRRLVLNLRRQIRIRYRHIRSGLARLTFPPPGWPHSHGIIGGAERRNEACVSGDSLSDCH
jgi:hypothetical protein